MHSLLERQLRKIAGQEGITAQEALLNLVSTAYEEYDRSLRLQDHATQLMSQELTELNATIRKESDEIIAQSQKRFELAIEGSNDGIWDWDVASDTLWLSTRCKTMLGYSAEQFKDAHIEDWYKLVAPVDSDKARTLIAEHLKWRMRGAATLQFNHVSGGTRHIMFRATTLQDSAGRVARLVGIHTDITDLITMQDRLKAAKEVAEQANMAKSEFIANMSHELRTPMHAILGFASLALKRVDAKDEKVVTMLSNIGISGNRLLALLNELLDLAKLESGKTTFEFKKEDIRKAINQALLELEPLFASKQMQVEIQATDADTTMAYDYRFMVQVFVNVLSNAMKFSPAASRITVVMSEKQMENLGAESAGNTSRGLLCRVLDQGVGIPGNELELVFDKFSQSSKTRTGAGGTGLGLSIVREIVTAHGGKIWAENLPEGGACINLLLPYDHYDPLQKK